MLFLSGCFWYIRMVYLAVRQSADNFICASALMPMALSAGLMVLLMWSSANLSMVRGSASDMAPRYWFMLIRPGMINGFAVMSAPGSSACGSKVVLAADIDAASSGSAGG